MKEKRILDALNDIDERWIEDAAPGRRSPKKPVWKRLVTAACLVLLLTGALFWMRGRFGGESGSPTEAAMPETQAAQTTAAGLTEAAVTIPEIMTEPKPTPAPETEAAEIVADATESPTEAPTEEEQPAEEDEASEDHFASDGDAETAAVMPGLMIDFVKNRLYYPITPEDYSRFGLEWLGLEDGASQITEKDLGPSLGTVTACEDRSLVGKTVYHYAACPDSMEICLLDNDGVYLFYVAK